MMEGLMDLEGAEVIGCALPLTPPLLSPQVRVLSHPTARQHLIRFQAQFLLLVFRGRHCAQGLEAIKVSVTVTISKEPLATQYAKLLFF